MHNYLDIFYVNVVVWNKSCYNVGDSCIWQELSYKREGKNNFSTFSATKEKEESHHVVGRQGPRKHQDRPKPRHQDGQEE